MPRTAWRRRLRSLLNRVGAPTLLEPRSHMGIFGQRRLDLAGFDRFNVGKIAIDR
jgi:hypothetical protein